MATKKVKKLAFGGMANRAAQMASMAKGRAMPQAPARGVPAPSAQTSMGAAGMKGLMNQPGMEKRQPLTGAAASERDAMAKKLAAQMAAQQAGKPMKKGGDVKHSDVKMDKKVVKKAVKMHDDQLHGGKKTDLTKLAKGGVAKKVTKEMEYDYKTGKKSFAGSTAKRDAHAEKEGKRVAKDLAYDMKKYAKGGSIDGCAIRGKTKATMVKMKKGGAC